MWAIKLFYEKVGCVLVWLFSALKNKFEVKSHDWDPFYSKK